MLKDESESSDMGKLGGTIILLMIVFFGTSFITSSFPQDILLNTASTFQYKENTVAFQSVGAEGATVVINGHQDQANNNDLIAMGGRQTITLTGHQTAHNGVDFYQGLLTIPTKLNHAVLFEHSMLAVPDSASIITITLGDDSIVLVNQGNEVYRVKSGGNNYNINLKDRLTYITDVKNIALYKVKHTGTEIQVTLVGFYEEESFTITYKD